ncbi:hypothetical protein IFU39_16510 [Paenibacillus sp. CFBP 13594]|uniref:hypothetical protein n=1 Tax=Paenibacillus sp. CFBP 13594 TaxID=2774037 RepID=UPI00177CF3CA|nr:hypothetical protein [Paenibacillus sp. CFBP 13594]MBD8839416.1 hypothetical protein [Paenibacillus sp. CFBP 13594]
MKLLVNYAISQNGRLIEKSVNLSDVPVLPEVELHRVIKVEIARHEQADEKTIKVLKWIEEESGSFEM